MKSNGKLCPLGKLVVKALADQEKTQDVDVGAGRDDLLRINIFLREGERENKLFHGNDSFPSETSRESPDPGGLGRTRPSAAEFQKGSSGNRS